jgi:hypothetical protein
MVLNLPIDDRSTALVGLSFDDAADIDRIRVMRPGDLVTAIGRIGQVQRRQLNLAGC